jgi:uncharacterized protein (TIGR03000 family)
MLPRFVIIAVLLTAGDLAFALPGAAAQAPAQARTSTDRRLTSRVVVTVPAADADFVVNGQPVPGAGTSREFDPGPLAAGSHQYTFSVTWEPNTYTTMTRTKVVAIRAGETARIDLTVDDPSDRVRVIYVPTPASVADAMVELARVSRTDVVYEPGCGDARITIAAIRAGASRGVCVDIDPERARESKANVTTAGFAERIDVREGDALDVKNLSDVSVVFLYMGDHFNLLIRPVLWRELKVGSRIVSHRFTMGDWESDRTITVSTDEGPYELHLWTITEDLKRRSAAK